MMKKLLSILLILVLLTVPLCAPAEEAGAAPAYVKAWICGTSYGYGSSVTVLVMSDGTSRRALTPEQVAEEIRFCPFDGASGLYAPGEGEPAGDRAEIVSLSDTRSKYTVRLKEPGRYLLSGAAYYLLDREVPAQTALRAELDGIVVKSTQSGDKKTAKALHDWLVSRVSPVFPAEDAERLTAACGDPMNALLSGYACREAYAGLNSMLLNAAGIRCLTVSGTAGEENVTWCLCELDGTWCWTDAALDDVNDKKGAKYFALDDKAILKDHALCAADEAFTAGMIRSTPYEAVAGGTVDPEQFQYFPKFDYNLDFFVFDGPAYVVGDSATVSFRFISTIPEGERLKGKTPMEFLKEHIYYTAWDEEGQFYHTGGFTPKQDEYDKTHPVVYRDPEELITVEEAAEDMSSFTLTFHEPGQYTFDFMYMDSSFYLISPEQAAPAALAAEMDKVVEKAKAAKTEKAGARVIYDWLRSKLRYNYAAWKWEQHPEYTVRDMETAGDAVAALLYGKCICAGYSACFSLLARQAGLMVLPQIGDVTVADDQHAWNAACLDGEWSYTDVTWGRFAWTKERMGKDHLGDKEYIMEHYCYGSAFDLLADQSREEGGSLAVLPLSMKFLPADIGAYEFPDKAPSFITPEVSFEGGVTVKLPQTALIEIYRPGGTVGSYHYTDYYFTRKPAREFSTTKLSGNGSVRIEITTGSDFWPSKKSVQWIVLDYEKGQLVNASYRQTYPAKAGAYPGYEASFRYLGYDAEMNPVSAGWCLLHEQPVVYTTRTVIIQVFFNAEGKVEKYDAEYSSNISNNIYYAWEGTADGTVTALKGKPVEDPEQADPGLWEPVWFE